VRLMHARGQQTGAL